MSKSVSEYPLMKECCKSCPFKENERGLMQNVELANTVIERNLFQSQQMCHSTRKTLEGKDTHRCIGYYRYSFEIYKRMGLEPEQNLK